MSKTKPFTHSKPEMELVKGKTALLVTDLQNEFFRAEGTTYYELIAEALEKRNVPDHIEDLLKAAKENDIYVIHSPHFFYTPDGQWVAPAGEIGDYLLNSPNHFVFRQDSIELDGFAGSSADFPERYKPYLKDGKTANTSPHRLFSTRHNDVELQLRMRRIETVIMAGPAGNMCLEAHMRDVIEMGFQVAMVRDATAGGVNDEGDGYEAAMVNWRYLAHGLWTTEDAVKRMNALSQ
ncbi:cysteine hydrolase family protein [Streptomyces sp. NPDC005195]|uniref:isochorismatase family cysteine hydrolase n=2 Tax=Streptomyces TaxID=1883 RepID=UPI000E26FD23|nr:cysteine hydrolase family protein [Streptomyces sp. 3212.3]REE64008.1 nicotinamidase-related amidase [Streptomyces sp. 3212.3]